MESRLRHEPLSLFTFRFASGAPRSRPAPPQSSSHPLTMTVSKRRTSGRHAAALAVPSASPGIATGKRPAPVAAGRRTSTSDASPGPGPSQRGRKSGASEPDPIPSPPRAEARRRSRATRPTGLTSRASASAAAAAGPTPPPIEVLSGDCLGAVLGLLPQEQIGGAALVCKDFYEALRVNGGKREGGVGRERKASDTLSRRPRPVPHALATRLWPQSCPGPSVSGGGRVRAQGGLLLLLRVGQRGTATSHHFFSHPSLSPQATSTPASPSTSAAPPPPARVAWPPGFLAGRGAPRPSSSPYRPPTAAAP